MTSQPTLFPATRPRASRSRAMTKDKIGLLAVPPGARRISKDEAAKKAGQRVGTIRIVTVPPLRAATSKEEAAEKAGQ